MKRTVRGVAALMVATAAMMAGNVVAQTPAPGAKTTLVTEKDKVSYAIGMDVG
ncbi:MAG: FKBP-type peptidyl-prolyl cis-trans isomerase, partial [Proteobacteria bacterium]